MSQLNFIDFSDAETESGGDSPAPEATPTEPKETGTALVALETLVPEKVFSDGGLDPIINGIRERVKSEIYDITTKEGRERIGSVARQIGSAKADLKRMSLKLTEGWREKTKTVTNEATRMEKELDALRDEIKEPLEQYKQIEANRVAAHQKALADLEAFMEWDSPDDEAAEIEMALQKSAEFYQARDWQEFKGNAEFQHLKNQQALTAALERRKKFDKDQAELAELRRKQAEQEQKDRDTQIAAAAAETARKEAEEAAEKKAAEERAAAAIDLLWSEAHRDNAEWDRLAAEERAENERWRGIYAEADADNRAFDAAAKAKADAAAAEQRRLADVAAAEKAERDRAAKEKADQEEAERQRQENTEHMRKIHNEIREDMHTAIETGSLGEDPMKDLIIAMAKGQIRHVKITY